MPGVFHEKGIPFALESKNSSTESLWFQAARCVSHGMDRDVALAAVTTTPARLLGLEGRVGKLEPGADGNVALFSGDPLSVTSFVEYVVIEGQLVYERSEDIRAKHILEGQIPANTAAQGETEDEDDDPHAGEDDEEEEEEGDKE